MKIARLRLRHAAQRLVVHGWPVMPGAFLRRGRFDCGRPGCPITACHPALEQWEEYACDHPRQVAAWWRRAPYAVLLPTGLVFDVIELPAPLGALILAATHRPPGPVATAPTGRWMFLVRPDGGSLPGLAGRPDLVRHGHGSWIPAPPTRLPEGPMRWVVSPREVSWRLPAGQLVEHLLVTARAERRPARVNPVGTAGFEPATPRL